MKKKIGIWGIVLIALLAGIGFFFLKKQKTNSTVSFQEARVERGDIQVKVLSTGTVEPENRLEIKPPIAGRVEDVFVEEGRKVYKGQKLALMSSTERAALLDAALAKGPEELKRWSEFYQAAHILAPINGTIILRNAEPGQTVTNQDILLVMSDRLTVKAQVDETDISEIHVKQEAEIFLDAYPNQPIPAQVDQIAFEAKTVNNVTTYLVDVLPKETPSFMKSGMTANVTFFVEAKKNVLRIPNSSIVFKNGVSGVTVPPKTKKEVFQEKEVQIGLTDGKFSEVLGGLTEGEVILVPQLTMNRSASQTPNNPLMPMPPRRTKR